MESERDGKGRGRGGLGNGAIQNLEKERSTGALRKQDRRREDHERKGRGKLFQEKIPSSTRDKEEGRNEKTWRKDGITESFFQNQKRGV